MCRVNANPDDDSGRGPYNVGDFRHQIETPKGVLSANDNSPKAVYSLNEGENEQSRKPVITFTPRLTRLFDI